MEMPSNSWLRLVVGAIFTLLYVHFLCLATQESRATGPSSFAMGLAELPKAVPFAVVALALLLSVFRRNLHSTIVAKSLAVLLLSIFTAFTIFCWGYWNRL